MKQRFKKHFIPCVENEYKPHSMRLRSVSVLLVVMLLIFVVSLSHTKLIERTNLLSAVIPSVLIDMANDTRDIYELPMLRENSTLVSAAQMKANDMAAKGYFSHNSPDGKTPWYWFDSVGYNYIYAGENLAVNFADSEYVNQAWLDSPTHRANILNGNFTEVGIATARGIYQGEDTIFVVQLFGRPMAAPAVAVETSVTPDPVIIPSQPVETEPPVEPVIVEPNIEPIVETETFIVVRNLNAIEAAAAEVAEVTEGLLDNLNVPTSEATDPETLGDTRYADLPQQMLASPEKFFGTVYVGLAALILVMILLSLWGEAKRHHVKHFATGLILFAVLAGLIYLYRVVVLTEVVIV